jgi:hypothetical protein
MKAILCFLLAVSVSSAFAQTPISSTFDLGASADADIDDSNDPISDFYSDSQGATLNSYSGSVEALDSLSSGDLARVYADTSVIWFGAGAGELRFLNGWEFDSTATILGELNEASTTVPVWTYTFQATENGFLNVQYNVVGTGETFGLQPWTFLFDGPGGGESLGPDPAFPDGSGSFTRDLVAGTTYTMGFTNFGNVTGGNLIGSSEGLLQWQVIPVPEPATLVALGAGALALYRRRRK